MQIGGKVERQTALDEAKAEVLASLKDKFPEREKEIKAAFSSVSKKVMREKNGWRTMVLLTYDLS